MTERISVKPKIIDLQNTNNIYMKMNIAILSEDINFNSAQFTSDFIQGVIENKENYIGIPFLVNKDKLENGDVDSLTHELDAETGQLKTDQIGSFVDFWEEEIDGANCLMGSIKIFKRFSETCSTIIALVEEDRLETSCEVMVSNYLEVTEEGVRKIHYNEGRNMLIGSAIVTSGAESRSKPTLLVAEAYAEDIESAQKGGEELSKDKQYNNGIKVEYQGHTETASLKFWEIEKNIYNQINPVDQKNGGRDYNYWIHTLFNDKVILEDDRDDQLYSVGFKVENSTVVLDEQNNWQKGSFQFVPDSVSLNELMEQNTEKVKELEKELNELKEEKENMSKKKDLTFEELSEKVQGLETEISDLKEEKQKLEETIVSQKEELVKAETTAEELSGKIEKLEPYKEQVEKAEKEKQQKELSDKYSRLFSKESFDSEEIQKAIETCDVSVLNNKLVEEISKKAEVETASSEEGAVEIAASTQGDLVEPTLLQKYGLS